MNNHYSIHGNVFVKRKIASASFIYLLFCLAVFQPTIANGQGGEWQVWIRTAPCSGRFDWVSVAQQNPTGGGNYFSRADAIFPSAGCTRQGCTFAAANAVANSIRPSPAFLNYCCRDYSVWRNPQTGRMTIVVGQFGTGGLNFPEIVQGRLCCEEAEALSGITGACSGNTSNRHNVQCYPGSYAATNPQTNRVECYCNQGLVWNSTRTACITPTEAYCSGYPGSYALWNQQTQRVECACPQGKTWNSTKTACVNAATAQVSCYPGSYAAWNAQTQRTECFCNQGLVWNSTRTACVSPGANNGRQDGGTGSPCDADCKEQCRKQGKSGGRYNGRTPCLLGTVQQGGCDCN
jgi:hypothetical protein